MMPHLTRRLTVFAGFVFFTLVILTSLLSLERPRETVKGAWEGYVGHGGTKQDVVLSEEEVKFAEKGPEVLLKTEKQVTTTRVVDAASSEAAAIQSTTQAKPPARPPPTSTAPTAATSPPSKIVVMGKLTREDTDWVSSELTDWQNAIYVVDLPDNTTSPTGHRTSTNKAKEAYPYLTYIIDNYHNLPDIIAFVHSHRSGWPQAWHTDATGNDAVIMLRTMRTDTVQARGYVNLRCLPTPGCPKEIDLFRNPPDPEKLTEVAFPKAYSELFNMSISAVLEQIPVVGVPCCAQFAVSKQQVQQRSRAEYEWFRKWIDETELDDDTSGRVFEYLWHIIFGQDAVYCPAQGTCYCDVYGRCGRHWSFA